ncbi:18224_t:CDS:2 [Dentiscutata erythropus]|uniref:18224_t:CDS:1 n=1 Tax=Dentiscutata erythropus TaxID=1348616 RepID=A0A9N9H0S3_9GLOM|nr:18224_t:CDS:2 [Dentiscutata erythropus]
MSEEKIILNIGGIKYETFRSTLTTQPETLLGTIFQDRNEYFKYLVNGTEYFFDRNGKAFYYIMEFYRTGKLLWPIETKESQVTYQQLEEELEYFQINRAKKNSSLTLKTAINTIDRFLSSLEQLIISHYVNFNNGIFLEIQRNNNDQLDSRLIPFREYAYDILSNMEKQIEKHLVHTFSELELKWNCYNYNYSFVINITLSSPLEMLLKSENSQAHIVFTQAPTNTSDEKIILNVGGKKYETFKSTLVAQPETLLGTMFQDRNNCMLHPINGNEYFFDRNSEAFYYIMEFYQTGKHTWPTESGKVTWKQLEEELDYFQIPFKKSTAISSSTLKTARDNCNNIILGFERLILRCCYYLINYIKLEIKNYGIRVIDDINSNRRLNDLKILQMFCSSEFEYPETRIILENIEEHIGNNLVERFSDLGLKWKSDRANYEEYLVITISFSFENVYENFN